MASFELKQLTVETLGNAGLVSSDPTNSGKAAYPNYTSKRLVVKAELKSLCGPTEAYYAGFIQVCTACNQSNHYGPDVRQKWQLSATTVSDASSQTEQPWYGTGADARLGPLFPRRRLLPKGVAWITSTFGMTDDFTGIGIARRETLAGNVAGPNTLTRVKRDQSFRLWLVAVNAVEASDSSKYKIFAQLDWRYELDIEVTNINPLQSNVKKDSMTYSRVGDQFHFRTAKLPHQAFNGKTCNEMQQLIRYHRGQLTNAVVGTYTLQK
jgi:hypothetical protein